MSIGMFCGIMMGLLIIGYAMSKAHHRYICPKCGKDCSYQFCENCGMEIKLNNAVQN